MREIIIIGIGGVASLAMIYGLWLLMDLLTAWMIWSAQREANEMLRSISQDKERRERP